MNFKKSIALSEAADRNRKNTEQRPELLCPAGSPAAFDAAIEAGADAIYFGGAAFNARINAKNFTPDDIKSAIRRAHAYGVKVYMTANTLVYDRELREFFDMVKSAYLEGVDAFIVADIGAAAMLKRKIPDIELHASTQLSGHNIESAVRLAEAGFSRMVCAREMSAENLREFTKNSPIEAEVFVHGALCVCHSGQCLFSSLVGKRSGNRGECAQPCRLPYKTGGRGEYPLSLKDLCLAEHITELTQMGVASFKIEGRMKSAEYVRDVTRIWRRLIDEKRNANKDEITELARIFSRGGFTDGYFRGNIGRGMLGVRSENNKQNSRELEPFDGIKRKIPIALDVKIKKGQPISLTVIDRKITVHGDIPEDAITAPITEENLRHSLGKLGGTPFELCKINIDLDEGLMVPISKLNALRRDAVDALLASTEAKRELPEELAEVDMPYGARIDRKTAVFYFPASITDKAKKFFDIIYMPLELYDGSVNGVLLPAVIFDSERGKVLDMLKRAKAMGAVRALVGNIGHLGLALESGLIPHGDIRLNVSNNYSMREMEKLGFEDITVSPELTLPRIRDIGGSRGAVVYGKIPLMVTEKCVGKELADCEACRSGRVYMRDRMNVSFPVFREWQHRSIIFNSVPFFMADRQDELARAGIFLRHFIFSDESAAEVDEIIDCYKNKTPYNKPIRRMN